MTEEDLLPFILFLLFLLLFFFFLPSFLALSKHLSPPSPARENEGRREEGEEGGEKRERGGREGWMEGSECEGRKESLM